MHERPGITITHADIQYLRAYCQKLTRNGDETDDIVQDALVFAWRKQHQFRGDSTLRTWMCRIVITTYLMRVRNQKFRKRGATQLTDMVIQQHAIVNHLTPEVQLISKENLQKTLLTLKPFGNDYEEILKHYTDGQTYTHIGKVLKLNPDTVKTRLHRMRQKLNSTVA